MAMSSPLSSKNLSERSLVAAVPGDPFNSRSSGLTSPSTSAADKRASQDASMPGVHQSETRSLPSSASNTPTRPRKRHCAEMDIDRSTSEYDLKMPRNMSEVSDARSDPSAQVPNQPGVSVSRLSIYESQPAHQQRLSRGDSLEKNRNAPAAAKSANASKALGPLAQSSAIEAATNSTIAESAISPAHDTAAESAFDNTSPALAAENTPAESATTSQTTTAESAKSIDSCNQDNTFSAQSSGPASVSNGTNITPGWPDAGQPSNINSGAKVLPSSNVEPASNGTAAMAGSGVRDDSNRAEDDISTTDEDPLPTTSSIPNGHESDASTDSDGSVFEIPEDVFAFLGGDPRESVKEMRKEQRRHEKAVRERRERERADEEFARQLQAEMDGSSEPSNMQRLTSQAVLDGTGRYRRSTPPLPPSSAEGPESSPLVPGPDPFAVPETAIRRESSMNQRHRELAKSMQSSLPQVSAASASSSRPRDTDVVLLSSDEEDADDDGIQIISRPSSVLPPHKAPALPPGSASKVSCPAPLSMPQPFTTAIPTRMPIARPMPPPSVQPSARFGLGAPIHRGPSYTPTSGLPDMREMYEMAMGSMRGGHVGANAMRDAVRNIMGSASAPKSSSHVPMLDISADRARDYSDRLSGIGDWEPRGLSIEQRDYINNDPTKTTEEIRMLLENIHSDADLPPENREGTPEAMVYPLMEHQKLGLAWLKKMEESEQRGGILADDMGLGKTIQALALMTSRRSTDPACKTTLIIAPVALMRQWEREIETKLKPDPQHRLKVYILHGQNRNTTWADLRKHDVVLTTFGTMGTELRKMQAIDKAKKENPRWKPTAQDQQLSVLGEDCFWYRIIIDEAQCIKNRSTKAALAAYELKARTRLCMTGTPMMNNVDELFSLLHFLRISPWNSYQYFSAHFSRPLKGHSASAKKTALEKLQVLLKTVLLRRTKKSKIDGRSILDLPPRTTVLDHGAFNDDERAAYSSIEEKSRLTVNKYLKAGTIGRHYSQVLVMILRLRQACCHPHLMKDFAVSTDVSDDTMISLAQSLKPDVVARLVEMTKASEENALECPVCMDMTENATIFYPCGHLTCSECFARITDPSLAIANGDSMGRMSEAKCPNCRGRISPQEIVTHTQFRKVYMEAPTEATPAPDDSDSDSDESLKDFIDDGEESSREERSARRRSKREKGKGPAKMGLSLAQLKTSSNRNAKLKRKYMKRLEKDYVPSTKIEKTMELLKNIRDKPSGPNEKAKPEKTIIFSQFTSLLDILEIPLMAEGFTYARYDGSMSANQRNDAVIEFTETEQTTIMLISLKAGNAGLNLTAASQVIILDPFWNPYIEEQAVDRAHRIGQRRPVEVHRILIADTVEDRILALQEQKRQLIESALDEGALNRVSRLGPRELRFLFNIND